LECGLRTAFQDHDAVAASRNTEQDGCQQQQGIERILEFHAHEISYRNLHRAGPGPSANRHIWMRWGGGRARPTSDQLGASMYG
jgi:hypothetical protein